ncbi:MHS family MFS transporter [Saccharopolyspora sp. HNM0983]|uniref:MHS family MFS transporter n=1 Tax=Saccharopolyspora montiporae TaxID=2781240 RepID=A0A929BC45_9PSEU|nr:MFS transporter [Saccharopolyspora sp. HNM0983]MBE9376050.1 MHS family MFS transporter [Saccharopolyspora sp. HNM0983]
MAAGRTSTSPAANQRRVAAATVIGTTVEWYDFFIYATAAGLVFTELFFEPAGREIGLLLSFATVGISFVFRPLGAFLAGHFGDRLGRRAMLVLTLLLMGGATSLIGLLPTYASAGVAAPVALLVLRILQGISAGGEWGGAVLMAVEHAPADRRGRAGSVPQLGVPLGMLLASGVTALMTGVISPGEEFVQWGWRVPFLLSVVLIGVGYFVRRAVDESPVFTELAEREQRSGAPVVELFRKHWLLVVLAALVFAGNNAAGYMTTGGFITSYATGPDVARPLGSTEVLVAVSGSALLWLLTTYAAGRLADRIGRRRSYICGYAGLLLAVFPMFLLVDTGDAGLLFLGLALFTAGLGLTYGPQAAWYAEIFPASMRYSGVAISYASGAIAGGAFAPTIATALVQATGSLLSVGVYLSVMFLIALAATLMLRDRPGIDLGIGNQAEQETGATVFEVRRPD